MNEELMDVVNEQDEVVATAPRAEVYAKELRHRIAHVFLSDSMGRIALTRRGKELNYCPDHWCSTAAGHVDAGETYAEAAQREMREEIGVDIPLTPRGITTFTKPGTNHAKFLATFTAQYEGEFVFDPREAQYVVYRTPAEIRAMLNAGELFHPETEALLHTYFL